MLSAFLPLATVSLAAQNDEGKAPVAPRPVIRVTGSPKAGQGLPLVFERNQGQFASGIGFVGRTEQYTVAVGPQDLRFSLPGAHASSEVVLSLRGGEAAAPAGITEAPFRTNYFLGSDPAGYRVGIRNYSRIGLSHVYPGIDAEFYATGSTIEHDFLVAPGADASRIAMSIAAPGKGASLSAAGDVVIAGGEGELRLKKPVAYQVDAVGRRTEVAAAFVLTGSPNAPELRFQLGAYDHARRLVIDPVIAYGSFFDGKAGSTATAAAVDPAGNVYLTGYTNSAAPTFGVARTNLAMPPSVDSALNATQTSSAAVFVAKFNPSGSASPVAWLSYFGSSAADTTSTSIALPSGAAPALVAVGGTTAAANLPTTPGSFLPSVASAAKRGFVVSFSTSTGSIAASTYLDSAPGALLGSTEVDGLAMDGSGSVYAVGAATGSGLPVTANALPVDSAVLTSTARKGFVFELTPTLAAGALVSYLAGNQVADTFLTGIALDASGSLYVGGYTAGSFPMAGAYSDAAMYVHNANDTAGDDAFAAELVPGTTSTTLKYSAWLSGSGDEKLNSLALDPSGNLFLFGQTASSDLLANTTYTYAGSTPVTPPAAGQANARPVTAAFPAKSGVAATAGFAAKLDPTGQPLVVTYLGGSGDDIVTSGSVDGKGLVYAAGRSSSAQTMSYPKAALLPTGQDLTASSAQHGFLLQLPNDLSAVNSVANIGGNSGPDSAVAVALDAAGNAYVGGNISSASAYTSKAAFQAGRTVQTGTSAYVAEIQPQLGGAPPLLVTPVTCTQPASLTDPTTGSCSPANPQPTVPLGYPDPIAFPNAANSTPPAENVTYYFTVAPSMTSDPTGLTVVTVQIPTLPNLTYTNIAMNDASGTPGATSTPVCSTANIGGLSNPGCTIATYPQTVSGTDDTFDLIVQAKVTSQPTTSTISVVPSVNAATYTTPVTGTELSNVAVPAILTISLTSQTPAASTSSNPTFVYTTNNPSTPPQPNTQVSYTFTITNSGAGDSTNTSFYFPQFAGLVVGSITTTSTTGMCAAAAAFAPPTPPGAPAAAIASCTNLTIPHTAPGNAITVTVTGTFPDIALGANASSDLTNASFVVSASGTFSYPLFSFNAGFVLYRGVHLAFNTTTTVLAGSGRPNGYFYLGDTLSFNLNVVNDGPSGTLASDADTVTIALPANATFTPQTGSVFTCNATTCTTTLPAIAAGSAQTLTLTGTFQDSDASLGVNASSLNSSIQATPVAAKFQLAANIVAGKDSGTGTSYDSPAVTLTSNVVRDAALTLTSNGYTSSAPSCNGTGPCLYMQNASNTGYAAYSVQVGNPGPDISETTAVTITLPTAGAGHPLLISGGSVAVSGVTGLAATPACSYTSSSTNPGTIKCSGFDMPAGASFTVTATGLTTDTGAVPSGASFLSATAGVAGAVAVTQSALGTPGNVAVPSIEVDRAAHLVTTKSVAAKGSAAVPPVINLAENTTAAAGVNDTLTVTDAVGTTALNPLPSATLTDTLPAFFEVTTAPVFTVANGATATCTVGGQTVAAGYTTGATAPSLTCTLGSLAAGTSGSTPVTQVTVSYSGKFVDNGVTAADITGQTAAAKVASLSLSLPAAVAATTVAVDPSTSQATSSAPPVTVQRLVQMSLTKTRNTTGLKTALDLDEEANTSNTSGFGTADELEFDLTVTNSGVNQALGIQVTDTLPPYFTLVKPLLTSGTATLTADLACYAGMSASGTPLSYPYLTGPNQTNPITCTYGTAGTPLALAPAASFKFAYQGKFQDNAPGQDDIPQNFTSYSFTSPASAAMVNAAQAIDNGTAAQRSSLALAAVTVQRAVHLTLVMPAAGLTNIGGGALTTIGGVPVAAEAQPSTMTGATPVYNCIRYKVYVQNAGPNVARQPQLSVTLPAGLVLSSTNTGTTGTPNSDAPLGSGCSYNTVASSSTVPGASLPPTTEIANWTLIFDLDGYFGLNTLKGANAAAGVALSYSGLSDPNAVDTSGTTFMATPGPSLTVVNTPYGSSFSVAPFSATATQPVALSFASVGTPGVTGLTVSTTLPAGAALPVGVPTDPRYTTSQALYRTGSSSPHFYTLGTSAGAVSGSTGLCVTSGVAGTAISDGFAKPERVLLWDLLNPPAGTQPHTVPNVTSFGDITSSVLAAGGTSGLSYVEAGGPALPYNAANPTLAPVQTQPLQVCGQVNGFAPTTAQTVVAVLEPVNFSPVITPNGNTVSQTPGKGVSEVSYLFPTSFDYNNSDPCYIASSNTGTATRQTCDDNLVLTTRIFGGEALIPSQPHIIGPLTPDLAATFIATTAEVQAGEVLYDLVTDQIAEAVYLATKGCDPGIAGSGYVPVTTVTPCSVAASSLKGTPPQAVVFTSGDVAQLTPSVNGGSSALIVLPPGATPTQFSTPVASGSTAATGTVTAGQSVGFLWRLRLDSGTTSGTYNLTCYMVDAATQSTVVPFATGITCQVPAQLTLPTDAPIYIVTQGTTNALNHSPGWKQTGGILFATLLVPFLLFRRRLGHPSQLVLMLLLLLTGAAGLSGCGSGGSIGSSSAVASGTYYFRVSATPVGGGATITSTAFSVKVVGGD